MNRTICRKAPPPQISRRAPRLLAQESAAKTDPIRVTEIEVHEISVPYEDWIADELNHFYGPTRRKVYVVHTTSGLIGLGEGDSRESDDVLEKYIGTNPFDSLGDETNLGLGIAMYDLMRQAAGGASPQPTKKLMAHRVKLTLAFYLGSCEVTQKQYREVIGNNPSHFSPTGPRRDAVQGLDTGHHPVENVSWFDAVDFCNKLSEREQRSPYYVRDGEVVKILGGTGYRLPTEAEWEYACRAGTTTRWSFGDNETNLTQHAWIPENAGDRTHRVGELRANSFGLYDLYGNVWVWCSDWHGDYAAGAVSDPIGHTAGDSRELRGGGHSHDESNCRSAARLEDVPLNSNEGFGFRVTFNSEPRANDTVPDAQGDLGGSLPSSHGRALLLGY